LEFWTELLFQKYASHEEESDDDKMQTKVAWLMLQML
jgi:hypothetical protein